MKLLQDINKSSSEDGDRYSKTNLWFNITGTVATLVILYSTLMGTLTETLFLIYVAVYSGSSLASKFLKLRFGNGNGNGHSNGEEKPKE